MALIAGLADCLEDPKQEMANATTKETRVTIFSTLERELWIGFPPVICVYWRCLDVSDIVETPQLSQLSTADALITASYPKESVGTAL
jgi:hypothetical protein